jgi:hypothetical protein
MKVGQQKHTAPLPTPRSIRRACENELYRTVKRLKIHVPPERMKEAEQLYVKRVFGHFEWINANRSNRKALANWWADEISDEISKLWNVERSKLCEAFRDAFGG